MSEQVPAFKIKPHDDKARIGVVSLLYHQQPGVDPISIDSRFSRWLESTEQPYLRKITIKEEWTPLDLGWIGDKVGMLLIKNEEGHFQIQPTEEQRQEVMARIVELAVESAAGIIVLWGLVRPLESIQFEPSNAQYLRLRCRKGQAKITLAVMPY